MKIEKRTKKLRFPPFPFVISHSAVPLIPHRALTRLGRGCSRYDGAGGRF